MNEWQTLTLADVCTVITDGAHQSPKTVSRGKPMASVKDLTRFGVDLTSARHIAAEDFEALVKQGCKPHVGDVLIAKDGNSALDTVCTVDHPLDAVLLSSVAILRPDPKCLDSVFLKFYLSSPETIDYLKSNFISGAAIPRVVLRDFKRAEIRLPSLDVQRRIAGVLQSIDSKIDLNRRVNQTLEAMAQAIFQSWFVDFDPVKAKIAAKAEGRDPLRAAMTAISGKANAELDALPPEQYEQLAATAALFPGEMEASELGEIPKGWSHKALLQLTDKIGSGSTPRGGKEVYLEEGVALIRSQNVYDSLFAWDGLARISDEAAAQLKGVTVQGEDVLLNITGASILRTCVVEPDVLPARVNQHVAIIRAKAGVPPRFIHMHLLRPDIKNYLLGLNAGASREAITKAHIESLVLLTPGPELLSAFQTAISPLFRQVHCLTRQMRALGELRDTLLPKLLSGELLVADAIAEAVA